MNRIPEILLLVVLIFYGNVSWASDGFGDIHCDADIPKALIGKHMSDEPVINIFP